MMVMKFKHRSCRLFPTLIEDTSWLRIFVVPNIVSNFGLFCCDWAMGHLMGQWPDELVSVHFESFTFGKLLRGCVCCHCFIEHL